MSVLDELPQSASVVVIRLRSLGDAVLTTPALQLLRAARPDLRVSVVLDEVFTPLLEGSADIDEVIRSDRQRRTQAIREIRKRRPALCLNLHGGTSSAWMITLSGAKHRAGFAHFRMESVYNIRIPRAQEILGLAERQPLRARAHVIAEPLAKVAAMIRADLKAGRAQRPAKPELGPYERSLNRWGPAQGGAPGLKQQRRSS